MTSTREPTPQDRLALSRKAIVRYMTRDDGPPAGQGHHDDEGNKPGDARHAGRWQVIKRAVRAWWQHHPAQLALDLAKPVLGKYADEKPLQLLGIAAGIGAAVVLIRPWRLVSVTGLLLATLKSSEVSGLVLSLLSTNSGSTTNSKDIP